MVNVAFSDSQAANFIFLNQRDRLLLFFLKCFYVSLKSPVWRSAVDVSALFRFFIVS